jgi:hypothetical protein
MEMQPGHRLFQEEENILLRLRAEACDSRWLEFVFVSGTVVAPIESCELQRFEIASCSRRTSDVHLTCAPWICDTRSEAGAAKDQYR